MYAGPIIDAHTHLWDLSMDKHPWLRPAKGGVQALGGLEKIRRTYVVEDYLKDSATQPIVSTVHVEALWDAADPVGETRWLETLDKSRGIASRYVGAAPLGSSRAAAILEQQAAYDRMVGIRGIFSFHPTLPEKSFASRGDLAFDPALRDDIARLERLGLTFEVMMYPYQLEGVLDLARSFPDLQLVINHCASPIDRSAEGMAGWREAVRRLASEPNIMLKVSNIQAYDPAPTYESLRAVALHCIETFGSERTILATDWPVVSLTSGFDEVYELFRRITADLSGPEQTALFFENARRLYKFALPSHNRTGKPSDSVNKPAVG
jgi:predicted TIM-barrel fold metal-dependent hydrolase